MNLMLSHPSPNKCGCFENLKTQDDKFKYKVRLVQEKGKPPKLNITREEKNGY